MVQAVERVRARFVNGPVTASVRRADSSEAGVRMSAGDFGYAIRGILYGSRGARELPAIIRRADSAGDVSELAQRYYNRAAAFGDFADGLHFAIFCAEDTRFIRSDEIDSLVSGAFIGTYLIDEYRTVCRDWPTGAISPIARDPLRSSVPTLLLSGWFDPVTPPETGARVAAGLTRNRHIVVRNEAHGAGFGCALPATLYVLVQGTLEGLPTVCEGIANLWSGR